ncbi:MAG: phosphoadenosine phosphosulfate reductase family protein [Clostridia bacterium]|nr:phosphoadenosine phosphosulfate reductase family protein [Clostridia bacterium]
MNHIESAIARVRLAYDALQQREPGEKLYVAYSGGKDSECIAQICLDGLGCDAVEIRYHVTGIDPPELVRHIKSRFEAWKAQGIECRFSDPKTTMHELIIKHGPPTRRKRFCCEALKEGNGHGRVCITGVRWAESQRRKDNHGVATVMSKTKKHREILNDDNDISRRIVENCTTKSRITVNPIVDWTDRNVWSFIRDKGIAYCSLYDEGFSRIGCIGCPMADKQRYKQFARWPHMKRYYLRSFAEMLARDPDRYAARYGWTDADDVWHWWMEDGHCRGQVDMWEEDEA